MLEVNAIYFILLAEGFVLLSILLLVGVLIVLITRWRKRKNLAALAAAIRDRSSARNEQSKAFLQAVYQFEAEELDAALDDIHKHETEFFQQLLNCFYRGGSAEFNTLDTSLDTLVKSFKCLQPRVETTTQEKPAAVQEIETLRSDNETLRCELSVANNKLSDMIVEFGEIFGGGKDHQLTLQEVMEKVDAMKAEHDSGPVQRAQK